MKELYDQAELIEPGRGGKAVLQSLAGNIPDDLPLEPGSVQHMAKRYQDYLDSFEPGHSRAGKKEWTFERWANQYKTNQFQATKAAEYVNDFRKTKLKKDAGWVEDSATMTVSLSDGGKEVGRRFDLFHEDSLSAVEVKIGDQYWDDGGAGFIRDEILKDAKLRDVGELNNVIWIFRDHASSNLRAALDEAGIPWKIESSGLKSDTFDDAWNTIKALN